MELSFFQKVFKRLRADQVQIAGEGEVDETGIPLFVFQRAMLRLFRVLQED